MQVRYEQKMSKFGRIALVFSQTGQIHGEFKRLIKGENRYKNTASRNVAFKASMMSESVQESQEESITQKPKSEETESDDDNQAFMRFCNYM